MSSLLARVESLKQAARMHEDEDVDEVKVEAARLDALVAPWFDHAVEVWLAENPAIKAANLAKRMGVDEHYLSKMRDGFKPVALRHILPLLDCQRAIEALLEPIALEVDLDPAHVREPVVLTEEDFKSAALDIQTESETGRFALAHRVAARKRVRPEYAMQLLKK